jgi:Flp pilus assembly protein protease CpaA
MLEVIFIVALGLVWVVAATIQDVKKREVPNWLNFSLIIFALGFRFFYSLFSEMGFSFFYQGLIGLGIFLIIGNVLYYGKLFAGGDAKLMIALGPILGFSYDFFSNIQIFAFFFIAFFLAGGIYGLCFSIVLSFKNSASFKKEFFKRFHKTKKKIYIYIAFAILFLALGFVEKTLAYLGILIFVFPYLHLYAKSVDEACMVVKVKPSKLTEGDWLYDDVKVGRKLIKARWDGLSKEEIKMLKKKRFVIIKQGIPFTPAFLIAFLVLVIWWFI